MALKYLLVALVAVSAVNPAATLASALYPSSSSSPEPQLSLQIQVLQEVVASILSGRTIVLYFDRAITPQTLRQITTLFILQDCSLVLVDLGSDGEEWCHKQSLVVLRGENIIHVAVFINDPRPFFMSVNIDTRWKPKYFLMYSLSIKDEVASLGVWSLAAHQSHNIFVDRFPTFEGYRFLLGTWFYDFPYLHQAKNKPEGEGDGVQVEVLNALATKLNYTFDLTTEPPDEKWGSFENGSWNGMLGMVHREEKNFTVNYFGYTNKRIEDFDATVSYWMEGFGLALLEPQPLPKWRKSSELVPEPVPREIGREQLLNSTIRLITLRNRQRAAWRLSGALAVPRLVTGRLCCSCTCMSLLDTFTL
ncbi:hypothetical protein E2C01_022874 [Portunus trituberculatus]|uniref:Ionotropic glutamate receptor L-glutamate and glycine-binding domain-containing protein n=1 Tax=Portunus trituberculatus TaxID=210409 RepID=A0A5B7E6K8_PORTR|nr:hypothetical protein [Portunus trituberculatus]